MQYSSYFGRQLLAHDRSTEIVADILSFLEFIGNSGLNQLLQFFILRQMLNIFHRVCSFKTINIEFCCMLRQPVITKDGSHTIAIPEMNVTYHSIHGAIQESEHVFIEAGLRSSGRFIEFELGSKNNRPGDLNAIFEMGFGTGLNALLTLIEAEKTKQKIHYTSIELFPLTKEETKTLNYCAELNRNDLLPTFNQFHECEWEKDILITPFFTFHKTNKNLTDFTVNTIFDLVYFDAFAPTVQPELWTKEIFEKIYSMISPGGILVTYCSKGDVRRAMIAAGFTVEKIPGPKGKREMLRAVK
jgi:tRNA U34 5-methylaminomethyl-2-thiouridine-forming methyltransferase MnmC